MPTTPPVVSYQHSPLVHLPGGTLPTPPFIGNAHIASVRFLPAMPVGASPGRAPPHAASDRLVPVLTVAAFFGRGPGMNYVYRHRLRRLRSSPTGAPNWCIFREALCLASYIGNA